MVVESEESGIASNTTDEQGSIKESTVLLKDTNLRKKALAYYSSALLLKDIIVVDTCICKAIFSAGDVQPIPFKEVTDKVEALCKLIKERHVSEEFIVERINYFDSLGEIQIADGIIIPASKTHKKSAITHFLY